MPTGCRSAGSTASSRRSACREPSRRSNPRRRGFCRLLRCARSRPAPDRRATPCPRTPQGSRSRRTAWSP
ncbi:hypothetical protein FJZ36_16280 [Candidatus Poribacteria bacterium]|nr:hypothetical protein [Candidatus Poribacteria bacterium]